MLDLVRRYPVTCALVAACVACYVLQMTVAPAWLVPMSASALRAGFWWPCVSSMFMHGSAAHLLCNMGALAWAGSAVESRHGGARTLTAYLLSGVAGNLLYAVFDPYGVAVGASGAIFGLVGVYAVDAMRDWRRASSDPLATLEQVDAALAERRGVLEMIAVNLALSLMPGIAGWAHVGGLLAGAACGAVMGGRDGND